ncbi:MAG: nucleotidyltransferase domain-containing protein [Firmicutes bacterium]|nr:nucleotidyltransferase domain-containing protein [Bacillota bacterium]
MIPLSWHTDFVVLITRTGSHAYGLAGPDSDEDYQGTALSPVSWLIGFPPADHAHTVVSHYPDDRTVHTLTKFCRLALQANPTLLDSLFCRDQDVVYQTITGQILRQHRDWFLSQRVYAAYSGYARDQLRRMRNHNTPQGSHADLIARYGYDTKNAMHLIRLLLMAKTALQDGRIDVYRSDREFLLSIRQGHYSAATIQDMAEALDADCQILRIRSVLPPVPDTSAIENWLMTVHQAWIAGDSTLLQEIPAPSVSRFE